MLGKLESSRGNWNLELKGVGLVGTSWVTDPAPKQALGDEELRAPSLRLPPAPAVVGDGSASRSHHGLPGRGRVWTAEAETRVWAHWPTDRLRVFSS